MKRGLIKVLNNSKVSSLICFSNENNIIFVESNQIGTLMITGFLIRELNIFLKKLRSLII